MARRSPGICRIGRRMAYLVRNLVRRGTFSGELPQVATLANGDVMCRAMSTSWKAESAGSRLGNFSVQVKGIGAKSLNQAMDAIDRREKLTRVAKMLERHRFHEKGFVKTKNRNSRKKLREEFKTATRQLNWMNLLKDRGVPIPGQRVGKR